MDLPFAHLNLRFNPFGEPDLADRPGLAVVELPALATGDAVQFVGESGRGKTTHLLALAARRPEAVYRKLDPGEDRCELPDSGLLLLDEAQRLRSTLLRRLFAARLTLALGTHEDLSRFASKPLTTVRLAGLSLDRLRAVVCRRIEWARRGPGPVPVVADASLVVLLSRHGDDLRAIEWRLYDAVQAMKERGHVPV